MTSKTTTKIIATIVLVFGLIISPLANAQTLSSIPFSSLKTSTYLSPVKMAPMIFTALGAKWDQDLPGNSSAQLSVRFDEESGSSLGADGALSKSAQWSDWYILEPDLDGKEDSNPLHPTAFIPVNPSKSFQYKVVLEGEGGQLAPIVQNLQFTFINSHTNQSIQQGKGSLITSTLTNPNTPAYAASVPNSSTNIASTTSNDVALSTNLSGIHIISRAEWGADESLRIYKSNNPAPTLVIGESTDYQTKFADELKIVRTVSTDAQGNQYTWPEQFPASVTKIIIHHTASTTDLNDPMKAIRDIYYFHTVSRGWGDIGYNYIIDQQGNIYEGRAGGDGVVGAHAGPGNIGSIGIAVLGDYQDNDVPEPVIQSLVALIKAKSQEYSIDPTGVSMFRGQNLPNVMGHRDIMSTSCPGDKLYAQLPAIRMAAKTGFKSTIINRGANLAVNQQNDFQVSQDIPLYEFDPGQAQDIVMTLKNTGQTTWNQDTYFAMNRDDNANNFFLNKGVVRSASTGRSIPPGQSAVFKMNVQAGYKGGFTSLEVFPMIDGKTKVEKYLSMPMMVKPAVFDYEIASITLPKPFLKIGEQAQVTVAVKNTGNITWERDGQNHFALGADEPRDHVNKLLLTPSNRLGNLQEQEVKPGDTGHIVFQIKGPKQIGPYKEFYTPLIEGISWFTNKGSEFDVYVYEKLYQGVLAGTSVETSFNAGEQKTVWFDIKNAGGVIWNQAGQNSINFEIKNIKNVAITGPTMQQNQVAPGETAHVSFTLTVPAQEGFYMLQIKPKIGTNYILQQARNYSIRVTKPSTVTQPVPSAPGQPIATTPSPTPPPATTQQPASVTTKIRIGLSFQGNPVITGNGPFHLESNGKILTSFNANQTAAVSYANNQYVITAVGQNLTSPASAPPRFVPDGSTILQIQNWSRPASGAPSIVYNQFRGVLEPHWYNNQLVTINELTVEDYLKGTGEIADSQPYEKIKAILVVARTYAMFYVRLAQKFPGAPYNLTDDPETSQKYVGFVSEAYSPNTLRAIADTAGEVVTYLGKLIKTPYFSSDDGRTRSAEEVWGWTDTPYLVSVPDPYCAGKTLSGHGVGLSGCGSLGMAQAGKSYLDIIKYYYQGVDVQKLY